MERAFDIPGSHAPLPGADPLRNVRSYPERTTVADPRFAADNPEHPFVEAARLEPALSKWSEAYHREHAARVAAAEQSRAASHTAALEDRKARAARIKAQREAPHALLRVGARDYQAAHADGRTRQRLAVTQGQQHVTAAGVYHTNAARGGAAAHDPAAGAEAMRHTMHAAAMERFQSAQDQAIAHLNERVDQLLSAWSSTREQAVAHPQLTSAQLKTRIQRALFPLDAAAPQLQAQPKGKGAAGAGAAKGRADGKEAGAGDDDDELDLSAHATRERFDALYALLNRLEASSAELKVWDAVWGELIASSSAVVASAPLTALLTRMRAAYSTHLSGFDSLFVEVRRRLQYDWLLPELHGKKKALFDTARARLDGLQQQLNGELARTANQTDQLRVVQQTLAAVSTATKRATVVTAPSLDALAAKHFAEHSEALASSAAAAKLGKSGSKPGGGKGKTPQQTAEEEERAANALVVHTTAERDDTGKLVVDTRLGPPLPPGASPAHHHGGATGGAADDDDGANGEFATPTRVRSPRDSPTHAAQTAAAAAAATAAGSAGAGASTSASGSSPPKADPSAAGASAGAGAVSGGPNAAHALAVIQAYPKLQIQEIVSGARVRGELSQDAVYYSFVLSPDDTGIVIRLEQTPEGDSHAFVELSINRNSPPTREQQTHFISTRDAPGGACLNLQHTRMPPGVWYIRVIGRGAAHKTFVFDFRCCTQLMDFSGAFEDVLTDIDAQTHFRASLADKMAAVDKLVATVQPRPALDAAPAPGQSGMPDGGFGAGGAGGGGAGANATTTTTLIPGSDGRYVMRRRVRTADKGVQATDTPLTVLAFRDGAQAPTSRSEELRLGSTWPPALGQFEPLMHFPAPDSRAVRVLPKAELYTLLQQIYSEKLASDAALANADPTATGAGAAGASAGGAGLSGGTALTAAAGVSVPPLQHEYTLCQFIYRVFHRKHGLAKLAEIHIYELVLSVLKHAVGGSEARVRTFARFCHLFKPHYTPADFNFFLRAVECTRRHIALLQQRTRSTTVDADTKRLVEDGHCVVTASTLAASAGELFANKAWAPYIAQRLQHRFIKPDAKGAAGTTGAAAGAAGGAVVAAGPTQTQASAAAKVGSVHPNQPVAVDYDEWLQILLDAHTGGISADGEDNGPGASGSGGAFGHERLKLQHLFATVDGNGAGYLSLDQYVGLLRSVSWWYSDLDIFILFRHSAAASNRADVISLDGFLQIGERFKILDKPPHYNAAAAAAAAYAADAIAAGADPAAIAAASGLAPSTAADSAAGADAGAGGGGANAEPAAMVSANALAGVTADPTTPLPPPPPHLADVPPEFRSAFSPALIPLRYVPEDDKDKANANGGATAGGDGKAAAGQQPAPPGSPRRGGAGPGSPRRSHTASGDALPPLSTPRVPGQGNSPGSGSQSARRPPGTAGRTGRFKHTVTPLTGPEAEAAAKSGGRGRPRPTAGAGAAEANASGANAGATGSGSSGGGGGGSGGADDASTSVSLMDRAMNELLDTWAVLQPLIVSQLSLMQRVLQTRHADYLHSTLVLQQQQAAQGKSRSGAAERERLLMPPPPNVSIVMQLSARVASYKELLLKLTAHRQAILANQALRLLRDKSERKQKRQRGGSAAPDRSSHLARQPADRDAHADERKDGRPRSHSRSRRPGSRGGKDAVNAAEDDAAAIAAAARRVLQDPRYRPNPRDSEEQAERKRRAAKRAQKEATEIALREREQRSVLMACAQVWAALALLLKDINDAVIAHPIPLLFNRAGGAAAGAHVWSRGVAAHSQLHRNTHPAAAGPLSPTTAILSGLPLPVAYAGLDGTGHVGATATAAATGPTDGPPTMPLPTTAGATMSGASALDAVVRAGMTRASLHHRGGGAGGGGGAPPTASRPTSALSNYGPATSTTAGPGPMSGGSQFSWEPPTPQFAAHGHLTLATVPSSPVQPPGAHHHHGHSHAHGGGGSNNSTATNTAASTPANANTYSYAQPMHASAPPKHVPRTPLAPSVSHLHARMSLTAGLSGLAV